MTFDMDPVLVSERSTGQLTTLGSTYPAAHHTQPAAFHESPYGQSSSNQPPAEGILRGRPNEVTLRACLAHGEVAFGEHSTQELDSRGYLTSNA